jgi:hypothetical protein
MYNALSMLIYLETMAVTILHYCILYQVDLVKYLLVTKHWINKVAIHLINEAKNKLNKNTTNVQKLQQFRYGQSDKIQIKR